MSRKEGAFATGRSILVVCENCCIVPDTANRQIARHLLYLGATLDCALEKWDIWMHDEKEKPTGFVAYFVYVRDLWVASDNVRRQIAHFSPVV